MMQSIHPAPNAFSVIILTAANCSLAYLSSYMYAWSLFLFGVRIVGMQLDDLDNLHLLQLVISNVTMYNKGSFVETV
jgi:hypothetical protein